MRLARLLFITLLTATLFAQTNNPEESLIEAVQRANSAEIERLLRSGVESNIVDEDGTPVLMLAVLFADVVSVEVLLDDGADPNVTDQTGASALMWAVPNVDKVRLLIERGADVNARSNLGRTPALIASAYPGTANLLQLLVDSGADIHAEDNTGEDAFSLARTADVDVVRFLVENDLEPEAPNTAFFRRPYKPSIDYLMSRGVKVPDNILDRTTNWQEPDLIRSWIAMGADVNAVNLTSYQRTPLMTAASSELAGRETLKVLLESGADPNAESTEGERPLDWAIYRSDQDKIDILEDYGAERGAGPRREGFPPPDPRGISDARVSVTRSVRLLLRSTPLMYERRACYTCHHNTLPASAAAEARTKGIAVNEELAQENLDDILAVLQQASPGMMQGQGRVPGGHAMTLGYGLMALAAEDYPLNKVTASAIHWALASQMPDGSWLGNGVNRPPIEYSTVSHTAMALRGLTLYPIPGRQIEIERALLKAQDWLVSVEASSAEERAMRLMGLVSAGAPQATVTEAMNEILAEQRTDGGWSQLTQLESDAYATGLSLFALHEAGGSVTGEPYRGGIAFLLASQYQDGAWFVQTRAFPSQIYFESGFPFGKNQWISAAGTGWAALAIAHTLPDSESAAE
jgi:ankyrin repeat protein